MNIIYRKANLFDIDKLIQFRLDFLTEDRGELPDDVKSNIVLQLKEYFTRHIGNDFIAFLAEAENQIVSGAFLVIIERPANPSFITGRIGTVLNVFTYPKFRRQGIATNILKELIKTAKDENLSFLELLATKKGRPLYEKLGFKIKNSHNTDMRLQLV